MMDTPAPLPRITPTRRAALAVTLPVHIDKLHRRLADEVPADDLASYLALDWMRWAAGRLVVTPRGSAVRDAALAREDAA